MRNKKRILQLNLNGEGGAFSVIYQLQKKLRDNYIFDYFCFGQFSNHEKKIELKNMNSKIYEFIIPKNRLARYIVLPFKFYDFLKNNNYEVIHINADTAYKLLIYAMPAKCAGVKNIIVHSHSSSVNGRNKQLKKFLHKLCRPFLKKYANTFLACSKVAAKWMYGDMKNVFTVKNGIDLKEFKFNYKIREQLRTKLGLEQKIVLGLVGDFSYAKNPEFVLTLLKSLPANYVAIFLGDGNQRPRIEDKAKQMKIYDKCLFLGKVENVADILNTLDIYLMPSRFEGLPMSAIEAQANGLVSLLSDRITDEAKVLPNCKLLSIDRGTDLWKKEIFNVKTNYSRENVASYIQREGFDVTDSSRQLAKFYK